MKKLFYSIVIAITLATTFTSCTENEQVEPASTLPPGYKGPKV